MILQEARKLAQEQANKNQRTYVVYIAMAHTAKTRHYGYVSTQAWESQRKLTPNPVETVQPQSMDERMVDRGKTS